MHKHISIVLYYVSLRINHLLYHIMDATSILLLRIKYGSNKTSITKLFRMAFKLSNVYTYMCAFLPMLQKIFILSCLYCIYNTYINYRGTTTITSIEVVKQFIRDTMQCLQIEDNRVREMK